MVRYLKGGATPELPEYDLKGGHIVHHTLLGAVQQAVGLAVGLLLLPYMLWQLGVERYGFLLMVQIFSASGIWAYADLGLHSSITRYFAELYVKRDLTGFRRLFVTGLVVFFALGIVCGLAVLNTSKILFYRVFDVPDVYRGEISTSLYLYSVSFLFHFPLLMVKAFYSGVQDLVRLRIWEIIERLSYGVAVFLILLYSRDISGIVLAEQLVAVAVASVFVLVAKHKYSDLFVITFDGYSWSSVRKAWKLSVHIFVQRLTYILYQKVPEVFVAGILGAPVMAHFAIIRKIPTALKTVQAAANGAVFPAAAAIDGLKLVAKLRELVLRGARYSYVISTPIAVFVFVFTEEILGLWVGQEYVFLANIMRSYLAWQYVMLLVLYLSATLTRIQQYKQLLPYSVAASALLLGLLWTAIPHFKLWGVIGALLLSAAIMSVGVVKVQHTSLEVSYRDFYQCILKVPVIYSGIGAATMFSLVKHYINPQSVGTIVTVFIAGSICHLLVVFRLGFSDGERAGLKSTLRYVRGIADQRGIV